MATGHAEVIDAGLIDFRPAPRHHDFRQRGLRLLRAVLLAAAVVLFGLALVKAIEPAAKSATTSYDFERIEVIESDGRRESIDVAGTVTIFPGSAHSPKSPSRISLEARRK